MKCNYFRDIISLFNNFVRLKEFDVDLICKHDLSTLIPKIKILIENTD